TLRRVAGALAAHGQVRRGYLGVGSYPVRLPAALAKAAGQEAALLVVSVQEKSPADKAGLVLGDALVSLDGTPLEHPAELVNLLDEEKIGKELALRIARAGKLEEIRITV